MEMEKRKVELNRLIDKLEKNISNRDSYKRYGCTDAELKLSELENETIRRKILDLVIWA